MTVQGPVKKRQPDGLSHAGGGGAEGEGLYEPEIDSLTMTSAY